MSLADEPRSNQRLDIVKAVETLSVLGKGFEIVRLGAKDYVRSVPLELNADQAIVLEAAQVSIAWTSRGLTLALGFRVKIDGRAQSALGRGTEFGDIGRFPTIKLIQG